MLEFTISPSLDTVTPEDLERAIDDHNKDPESHTDIRQAVKDTVNTHNSDETSHPDIRVALSGLDSRLSVPHSAPETADKFEDWRKEKSMP